MCVQDSSQHTPCYSTLISISAIQWMVGIIIIIIIIIVNIIIIIIINR